MWVCRQLFKRLYDLVVPGGEIPYFLIADSDMFTVWKQMSKDPVWGKYYQMENDKAFALGVNPAIANVPEKIKPAFVEAF
ncbi:unnamed protein product, partial [Allacma fusca]